MGPRTIFLGLSNHKTTYPLFGLTLLLCFASSEGCSYATAPAPAIKIHTSRSLVAWLLKSLRSMLRQIASRAYFFPLPITCEGQGKEMSFCKDQETASSIESAGVRLAVVPKVYDIVELAGHRMP